MKKKTDKKKKRRPFYDAGVDPNDRASVSISKVSPYTGVKFPEGSRRIAFEEWVHCGRSLRKTRLILQKNKRLSGGRVPSLKTMQMWHDDGHWEVLGDMVDDQLLDVMQFENDPDLKEAIKDEETYFKVLEKLRSHTAVQMLKKNSPLMPRTSRDAVIFLKFVADELGQMDERLARSKARKDARKSKNPESSRKEENEEEESDERIIDIASRLADKGEPVTMESVARAALKAKKNKN